MEVPLDSRGGLPVKELAFMPRGNLPEQGVLPFPVNSFGALALGP